MKSKDTRLYDLAVVIRNQRIEMGYSSAEKFSNANGINRSVYQRWESGEDLNLSSLLRLCDILGISASDMFKMCEKCNDRMPKTRLHKRLMELREEIRKEDEEKGKGF